MSSFTVSRAESGTAPNSPRHIQLVHAAQQFEAVMLTELMKPLQNSTALAEEDDSRSSNSLQAYGVEAMAGALARSGALGFASTIVRSVEAREAKAAPQEHFSESR